MFKAATKKKAGYVGVVGLPNVGKSTLVNHFIKAKVCITSNKPQTTRKNILGILTRNESQFIFVDSPGFIQTKSGLNSFLESEWKKVIKDIQTLIFVFAVDSKKESFQRTLDMLDSIGNKKVAIITKVDLGFYERELIIQRELEKRGIRFFKASRKGKSESLQITDGCLDYLESNLLEVKEFYYDKKLYTTQTLRELSAEIVLENIFRHLSDELPYEISVQPIKFEELPTIYKIYVQILISKERYKKIIIGKNGNTIKRIGTLSRKSLELEFGMKVFLDLRVKFKKDWNKNIRSLKELGYGQKQ